MNATRLALFIAAMLVFPFPLTSRLAAQPAAGKFPLEAVVNGENVYVRSGPSLNYYPVTKLQAGAKITVVGEQNDWLEVLPPADVFSLISGDFVTSGDDKAGVVNGENVQVRAASLLPEFAKDRYKVQVKLAKGDKVKILERQADGYLRIAPPAGATLWITRKLVDLPTDSSAPSPAKESPVAEKTPDTVPVADKAEAEVGIVRNVPTLTAKVPTATTQSEPAVVSKPLLEPVPVIEWSPMLEKLQALDKQAQVELDKPLLERRFDVLIAEYQAIADQVEGDESMLLYASGRVEQLKQVDKLGESVRRIRKLTDEADSKRREHLAERASIRDVRPPMPTGLDAKGELKPSAVYTKASGPRRYRLVDPFSAAGRTIGYVELAENSAIDVDAYLGQYVGVRASETKFLPGGIKPVPVYIASELIVLQREDDRAVPQPGAAVSGASGAGEPKP